jgi:hypothetical protein
MKKRILTLFALAVVTVGAWADPTMTLTLKSGNSKVSTLDGTTFVMDKISDNLWKLSFTLPANNADGSYNFSVAGVENESAIVTAGTGYFKLNEEKTVNIYATIKNIGGTDKVFSSCDGMRVVVGKADYVVIGIIPSVINGETSSTYFSINSVGSNGKYEFVPLGDHVGTKYATTNEKFFVMPNVNNSLLYQITTPTNTYSFNAKSACWGLTVGLYKATVDYKACTVTLAKQDTYSLSIGNAGAATLVLPCEMTLPSGLSAYTLEKYDTDHLIAHTITGTIPAKTPVLINGSKEGSPYEIALSACSFPETTTTDIGTPQKANNKVSINDCTSDNNNLYGVFQPHYVPENSYVLQNGASGIGFYKVNVPNYAINAFRCYVTLPAAVEARSLSIVFDDSETTGIADVRGQKEDGRSDIFNLSGQRVGKDYKGVVIKNGRKMIQK